LRRKATALLESGNAYTIGAVGLVGDGSITGEVYQDDLTPPAQGNSKLRLVYASPDACPVDVVPAGGVPLVSGLQFPNASPYAQVPAGLSESCKKVTLGSNNPRRQTGCFPYF
jgi:hypothetical protein